MRTVVILILGIIFCVLGFEALNQSDTIINICGVVLIFTSITVNVLNFRRSLKNEKW